MTRCVAGSAACAAAKVGASSETVRRGTPTTSLSAPSAGVEKLTDAPGASFAPTSVKPPPVLPGAAGAAAIEAVPAAIEPRADTSAFVPDRYSVSSLLDG